MNIENKIENKKGVRVFLAIYFETKKKKKNKLLYYKNSF
jgi:hypothetical protein